MSPVQGLPILYSFRRCPYAMRARLALAASGQRHELREVVLRDKPAALRQASPKATVPVLVLADGRVLDESLDIMLWALRANDPLHWLRPPAQGLDAPAQGLDDMLALIGQCDTTFKHHLDRYKYPGRHLAGMPPDRTAEELSLRHRDEAAAWLRGLEPRLGEGFLFGRRQSLADMAIAPFVRQYAHVDKAWFESQPWPRLSAWLAAWLASDLFGGVMKKYAPWKEGAEKVVVS